MRAAVIDPSSKARSAERWAVECRALTKRYGEGERALLALRGVDLQIGFGEMTMLVGPSGCGKTTLISVIAGILARDDGECRVLDRDLDRMSGRERTRWRGYNVGFVFQSFHLIPALSVVENTAVPLLLQGAPRSVALARAQELLEHVELGDRARALPAELSGGQQQRAAIARALVHEPRLIVCDEPTSALDAQTGQRVMRLFRAMAVKPGRSLVIVTHDPRILDYADRVVRMDDGRIEQVHANGAPA